MIGGPVYPATIDAKVEFRWPLIGLKSSVSRHFSSRRDALGRIYMVPDTD
jgi:hypothetical protein